MQLYALVVILWNSYCGRVYIMDEYGRKFGNLNSDGEKPEWILQLLMQFSGGAIKTLEQAKRTAYVIIVLLFAISIALWLYSGGSSEPRTDFPFPPTGFYQGNNGTVQI